MVIHPDTLLKLPFGGSFQVQNDRATATVTRFETEYEFRADCDSLTILVRELETEIYHLNKENTVFKEQLNEQEIIEVNRLTSFQSFQIWTGRICLFLLACLAGYQIIKLKLKIK